MVTDCDTCIFERTMYSRSSMCSKCDDFDKYIPTHMHLWREETVTVTKEVEHDPVSKPKHYMLFPEHGIEVRDVIKALVRKMDYSKTYHFDGVDAADYFQAMQYFMRFMEKNGKEDLEKGVWYINKMLEAWDDTDATNDT